MASIAAVVLRRRSSAKRRPRWRCTGFGTEQETNQTYNFLSITRFLIGVHAIA